jgi:hypothetical protein
MLLTAHAIEDPERASKVSEAPLPPELDALLAKALQKEPTERFQTAREFLERIESVRTVLLESPRLLETRVYQPLSATAKYEPAPSSSAPAECSRATAQPSAQSLSIPVALAVFLLVVIGAAALGSLVVLIIGGSWP